MLKIIFIRNKNFHKVDVNQNSNSEESGNGVTTQSLLVGDNIVRPTPTALYEVEHSSPKPVNNNYNTENCFNNNEIEIACMQTNKTVKDKEVLGKYPSDKLPQKVI